MEKGDQYSKRHFINLVSFSSSVNKPETSFFLFAFRSTNHTINSQTHRRKKKKRKRGRAADESGPDSKDPGFGEEGVGLERHILQSFISLLCLICFTPLLCVIYHAVQMTTKK